MQKHRVLRALAAGLALSLTGCGWVEHDPHRFEQMAERVAAIPVTLDRPGQSRLQTPMKTRDMGLRDARADAVRVEVMDPHDLWEARDGAMEGLIQAAAPVIAEATVDTVGKRVSASVPQLRARPVSTHRDAGEASLVQLGAFGSEASARTAWARIRASAPEALAGLTPRFEPVTVDGRSLVRLKVAVPASGAAAVCAAARIQDPWCQRGT
ncbi:SPOR domain-containing protein [Brevundimonas sp.]|uniref:SPOR domain-containing protein n=1 Tax=Brevundimonas sp. TaxID=1871086 RepID=UPI001DE6B3BF|nr:SPOR domain-containing protein [Brevundimonas sp.]MBL0947441.1 SPOR domain-containing protein [Brevundimonas sp.]